MDLIHSDFTFNLDRQFHCLRHFSFDGNDQLRRLEAKFPSYSTTQIQQELELIGSKFHADFAQEPFEILDQFKKASRMQIPIENNKTLIQFAFSKDDFPNGIGNSALLPLSELDEAQQARKYKVKRGDFEVWTCEVAKLPTSNKLSIIAFENQGNFDIITLFPGEYAPAFPRGTSELDEQNRMFWEGHCLLSTKQEI